MQKSIVSTIILRQGKAVTSLSDPAPFAGGDPVLLAEDSSNRGADALLLMDQSRGDEEHDLSLTQMRQMARLSDIPMWGAGNISRPEDVKKILYAGCRKAVLNAAKPSNLDMLEEVVEEALGGLLTGEWDTENCALEGCRVQNYENAGVMTYNKGLVISLPDGSEFQLTIVQSR